MKKYWLLIIALVLGFSLRFYNVANLPNGLTWDETALGYNAYSILKTGKDEFGQFMPLIFKSFGDYKPGLYVYLTVPSIAAFGLNEFSVRLPSVIFGTLAILGIYLLVFQLFKTKKDAWLIASLAALALAISPWHVHFSRAAWETNVYSTLLLFGLYFWLRFLQKEISIIPALIFACASLITYQSAKLLTPLNFLVISLAYWKDFIYTLTHSLIKKVNLIPLILAVLFSGWFFYTTLFGIAGNRLTRLSIFGYRPGISAEIKKTDNNIPLIYELFHNQYRLTASLILSRYLYHFSPEVLFYEGSIITERGHIPQLGMLIPLEFIWLFFGLIFIAKNLSAKSASWGKKEAALVLVLLLLAPLPGSLTLEEFSTVRSHFMTIPLAIVSGLGIYYMIKNSKLITLALAVPYLLTTVYTFDLYFNHSQQYWAKEFNYGYKQAMQVVNKYPGSRVIMTDVLGQPYIYYLFYSHYDPAKYQQQNHFISGGVDVGHVARIGNVEFRQFSVQDVKTYKNTVFIGTSGNVPDNFDFAGKEVQEYDAINYPDGSGLFRVIKTY